MGISANFFKTVRTQNKQIIKSIFDESENCRKPSEREKYLISFFLMLAAHIQIKVYFKRRDQIRIVN